MPYALMDMSIISYVISDIKRCTNYIGKCIPIKEYMPCDSIRIKKLLTQSEKPKI